MRSFLARDFTAQWRYLAPVAQEEWPNEHARSVMLGTKFPAGSVAGFALGQPVAGATWTSGENLRSVAGLWRIPVQLTLLPSSNEAQHSVQAFQDLPLYVDARTHLIVGEGPAAIDAPLFKTTAGTTRSAHVPILMYHVIAPLPDRSHFANDYAYRLEVGLTVTPGDFADQMQYLASTGHHAISLVRLFDYLLYGLELPARPVVITFDDARLDPYVNAVPVLLSHHFTATFFVPVHFVGNANPTQRYMSWTQIDSLSTQGFWIEDHSLNHVSLWRLSGAQLDLETGVSRAIIEKHTNSSVQFLAYPGAWPFPDATSLGPDESELFPQLQAQGYAGALTDPADGGATQRSDQPFQLPRIRVNPGETIADFASRLNA